MIPNRFISFLYFLIIIVLMVPSANANDEIDITVFKPARYILSVDGVLNSLQGSISAWPKNGYWVPDEMAVNVFESEIIKTLADPNSGLRPFNEYTVQYIGLTKQGVKLILANAFCYAPPEYDIARQLYVVSGGGNCYFGALFDPEGSKVIGFSVNENF